MYFSQCTLPSVTLRFQEIENIMGQQLPNAAYLNSSWWKKTKPPALHYVAWTNQGYVVEKVDLGNTITFVNEAKPVTTDSTSDHHILIIRQVDVEDARSIIELQMTIEAESDFLLYGKDERKLSVQAMRKRIMEWRKMENSAMFVAISDGNYAGFLLLLGNSAPRAKHRASLFLGVKQEFQRKGIATALIKHAESFASSQGVHRLELTVIATNDAAIALYKHTGFEQEGLRRESMLIDNTLHDELYMGKILIK
ncbi:GNAT family N-acetyltransferase [Paenisporosarcina cavernae]